MMCASNFHQGRMLSGGADRGAELETEAKTILCVKSIYTVYALTPTSECRCKVTLIGVRRALQCRTPTSRVPAVNTHYPDEGSVALR